MSGKVSLKQTPDLSIEKQYNAPVCGIDEVGRGPLAGPVLSACVYIPEYTHDMAFWDQVTDSKKISTKKREVLFLDIRKNCAFGFGLASVDEIDTLNIHHATLLAMRRAYQNMLDEFEVRPNTALIDGKFAPELRCNSETITKGDTKSLSIAAASILAKVTRDRIMRKLHNEFPHYGWESNSGYGTAEHLAGIEKHGVTEYHRQSFAPVKRALFT
jgi:ribonuclease HII